jgi:hypothetical protein
VDKEEKALGSLRESIPDRIREGGSSTCCGLLLAEDETHGGGCSPAIPLLQEATRSGEKESRNPSFGLVEEDEQKRRRRGLIRRQRQGTERALLPPSKSLQSAALISNLSA